MSKEEKEIVIDLGGDLVDIFDLLDVIIKYVKKELYDQESREDLNSDFYII